HFARHRAGPGAETRERAALLVVEALDAMMDGRAEARLRSSVAGERCERLQEQGVAERLAGDPLHLPGGRVPAEQRGRERLALDGREPPELELALRPHLTRREELRDERRHLDRVSHTAEEQEPGPRG